MRLQLIFLLIFVGLIFSPIQGQNYNAYIGAAMHGELGQSTQKNIEKINTIGYMATRNSFSFAQGAAFAIGFQSSNDSSNLTLKMGVQHLFGNTIQAGANGDSNNRAYELWQSNQTNLQLGIGFKTKGKHSVEIIAGPVIPLFYKSSNTLNYSGTNEAFNAQYKVKFKSGLGIHLSTHYLFKVNEQVHFFAGGALQLLNRKISTKELTKISYSKGADNSNFAQTPYDKKQIFVNEVNAQTNDANINPKNFDANKPRETLTQSYSFGSLAVQFGLLYIW